MVPVRLVNPNHLHLGPLRGQEQKIVRNIAIGVGTKVFRGGERLAVGQFGLLISTHGFRWPIGSRPVRIT